MSTDRSIRIGIDVGGTFTHAVAVDGRSHTLLGKSKVATTHSAKEGVALGIIEALKTLLVFANISAEQVSFIAHSTTQATNALLEGDVATVGIIGMGSGSSAWLAKLSTNPGKIILSPQKVLKTHHRFIDTSKGLSEEQLKQAFAELKQSGAQTFAISEAFSVDNPENEHKALKMAQDMGLMASAGSEISQLYGLRVRTRTAIINAAMLPKMLETANLTEQCVLAAGIKAPLMIMRSDGGVMDIAAMRRRPLLTMLSGPAAGVAAAMMFLRISDGIFIEVGGTSSDISVITNGRAQVRSAEIGGHKIFMRTLDVKTVGVAGGSMPRIENSSVIDVGPRSAHIAGLKYMAFSDAPEHPVIKLISPLAGDPADYATIVDGDKAPTLCLTTTCAANLLGLVPKNDCALGNTESVKRGFDALATTTGKSASALAEAVLAAASTKCLPVIKSLLNERKLDAQTITIYGGGGGAAALVPYLAKHMEVQYQLADSADVVSAIGVALALIRESVERQIINPTNDDILKLRNEAAKAIARMGAAPSSIQIFVEIDPKTNTVRATATGATSLTETATIKSELSAQVRLALISASMKFPEKDIKIAAETDYFQLYSVERITRSVFGLLKRRTHQIRILDAGGTIRFQATNGEFLMAPCHNAENAINELTNRLSTWGDAGKTVPNIILCAGTKIVDLSGLMAIEQIISLAKTELAALPADCQIIVVATHN